MNREERRDAIMYGCLIVGGVGMVMGIPLGLISLVCIVVIAVAMMRGVDL